MRGMPTANKIKARRNHEGSAIRKRLDLTPRLSEDYGSYHSHHHLTAEVPDSWRIVKQPVVPRTTKDSPDRVSLPVCGSRFLTPKVVDFSSKDSHSQKSSEEQSTAQKHSTAAQAQAEDELQKYGAKRRSACFSKLVQTCSTISEKKVSCRSIAVGISNIDYFQERPSENERTRPVSRKTWWNAAAVSRKNQPPGSCATISSVPYSRTESSIVAALEVPPASHRHAQCMAAHSFYSPEKKYPPVNYRKKKVTKENSKQRNSTPAKETVRRKPPQPKRAKPKCAN